VKALPIIALGAVIAQGTLGGITVLFRLPATISIGHAGLAQAFFCLTVTVALALSRGWRTGYAATPVAALTADSGLRRMAVLTTAVIYLQILIGATIRHTGAGLAIPDFPLAFGGLVPPLDRLATAPVAIQFLHRVVAVIATAFVFAEAARIHRRHRSRVELTRPALVLCLLIVLQIAFGGLVVLTGRNVIVNTAHVANGALVLATALVVALRIFRPLIREGTAGEPALSLGRAARAGM
jgi:cytochrome c oxidase assembly protein subunit 15